MEWFSDLSWFPAAAWGAATGTIGTIFGGVALWLNWLNRRDAKAKSRKEAAAVAPWAQLFHGHTDGRNVRVRVAVFNPSNERFRITELKLKRPWRARITLTQHSSTEAVEHAGKSTVTVSWPVYEAPERRFDAASGWGDVWIKFSAPPAGRDIRLRIWIKGQRASPMREPIHMIAEETITP